MICQGCGNHTAKDWKVYCDKQCQRVYEAQKVETQCRACGQSFLVCQGLLTKRRFKGNCPSCRLRGPLPSPSGAEHPRWQGGFRYWSPGRFGKDKNGLSWKTQRKLAWERDNFVCQHCGEKKNRKPDVHHIKPWMTSKSHDLANLVCLCQSCHLKEEARLQRMLTT